jgi:hypothetical protein
LILEVPQVIYKDLRRDRRRNRGSNFILTGKT